MMESIISNAKTFQEVTMPQSDLTIYLLQKPFSIPEPKSYVNDYPRIFSGKDEEFEFLKSVSELAIYPFSVDSYDLIMSKMLKSVADENYYLDFDKGKRPQKFYYKNHTFNFKVLPYRK